MGANVSILSAAKYFFQTMSTYIPLEPQLNADESFLGNYGGQIGSKGSKSNFLEGIVVFFLDIYQPIYRWDGNLMSNRVCLETMV